MVLSIVLFFILRITLNCSSRGRCNVELGEEEGGDGAGLSGMGVGLSSKTDMRTGPCLLSVPT